MVSGLPQDGITVVGLLLVRNEEWVIGASLRAALQWCDKAVVYMDRCIDRTKDIVREIAGEYPDRVISVWDDSPSAVWNEMDMRHQMLLHARQAGGTHFAIVDADEILTANNLPLVRNWFRNLAKGQLLEVPMVPVWDDINHYRSDACVWSRARLTFGWRDNGEQGWKAREDGYQHHARAPHGVMGPICNPIPHDGGSGHPGGVMHLQFGNRRRLIAKHVLYRMVDHLRWPGRRTPNRLNQIYDEALAPAAALAAIPGEWNHPYRWDLIDVAGVPWQEQEIGRLLAEHGRPAFEGLDLKQF